MSASLRGFVEVGGCSLQSNADVSLKDDAGDNALLFVNILFVIQYNICKLLMQHSIEMNIVVHDGKSILETANGTDDWAIISLIKKYQNMKTVNTEIMKTGADLKKLQTKQIIGMKRENLSEIETMKTRLNELKQLRLKKQEEKVKLEAQVEVSPAGNYMFKVNNKYTRARCETCSKLTIKTP